MKKLFIELVIMLATTAAMAVPAKRGLWRNITLADGTTVQAQLKGDEFVHYWVTDDGRQFLVEEDGTAVTVSADQLQTKAAARRSNINDRRKARLQRKNAPAAASPYTGQKKGLILLVNFTDVSFQEENDWTLYNNIANTPGYTDDLGFEGSVYDYFKEQSHGLFELTFDVVGPLALSKPASYYGQNNRYGQDKHPAQMVIEAIGLAKQQVSDWSQYDWDNDGEVDQVMVIYAGEGEATGGDASTIWPHEFDLYSASHGGDGTGPVTVAENLVVNTYAVANECSEDGFGFMEVEGIGVICHEFTHCLGLMDMYDTEYTGNYGMYDWSLMDNGSYNGYGFVPAGYTSFEKYSIGWLTPIELTAETSVTDLQPLSSAHAAYIIRNAAYPDEYYMLENRQLSGFDRELPAAGMLILHVDYDKNVWDGNAINAGGNDAHEHCTIFHADGMNYFADYSTRLNKKTVIDDEYYELRDKLKADVQGDVYPQANNNQLTNTSTPRAFLYNKNTDGRKLMNVSITNITQNEDGTISFHFAPDNSGSGQEGDNTDSGKGGNGGNSGGGSVDVPDNVIFYESFDDCAGKGGNDGDWNGSVASSQFNPDHDGWVAAKSYGAYKCAKFGTGSENGSATTPSFVVNGEATLFFRAGAWDSVKDGIQLNLSVTGGTISSATETMKRGAFTSYTLQLTGNGSMKVTFAAEKGRFFLDDVIVYDPTSGIDNLSTDSSASAPTYDLYGRQVKNLNKGFYIVGGKKAVVR
ncbi:MAG: M6 family metalloprotease domain-containing protein [Bacteroidales bacterium]|nr:M6 family metalloprotease domain-containing protein [Bacteroidales bacterium]